MSTIILERRGGRVDLRLSRPEVRNAFDDRLVADLRAALEPLASDESVRCVVLSGQGPVFCAGADLGWMRRAATYGFDENLRDAKAMAAMFRAFAELPCPTVAIVRGAALGGGSGLAACADVALAAASTKFGFTEVRLGIVPAVISAFAVRKIGRGHAKRYFQTGEIFDGRRAAEIGLVSEAVPDEELDARAEAVVAEILAVSPRATRIAKRLADQAADTPYPRFVDEAARLIAELRATPEAREGLDAFLEKRAPAWRKDVP